VIDDQHQVFANCIRRLEEAMADGEATRPGPQLAELSEYVDVHFGRGVDASGRARTRASEMPGISW
jgi:hypothetical protein